MNSNLNAMPTAISAISNAAAALAGETIVECVAAGKGANSRTYRVTTPSRRLALKSYPKRAGDGRDRLAVEVKTLNFLRRQGLTCVPEAVAADHDAGLLLMQWCEGDIVQRHTDRDLQTAIDFMATIFRASDAAIHEDFPPASEACLSSAEIVAQIHARLNAFATNARLENFLDEQFRPRLAAACAPIAGELAAGQALAPRLRRLIPADFGFHNALRTDDGQLSFIDFDYFGWDDPVKLTADFVLHPAMRLSGGDKAAVIDGLEAALPADGSFRARLQAHRPLYALRWALILLNPFRADRLEQADPDDSLLHKRLDEQLQKAALMCEEASV
ncbi:MAG: aminoglycoside phosphotransferase family protein [Gammaproteobacteria bacterium]|nr:aminoglycoside phosphotransferase family protein [Gammaproteobacteria bacterium]